MYILQIKVANQWMDHDEFEQYEAAKVAQDFYKHDYKHLQTRIVKEEMEDDNLFLGGFVVVKDPETEDKAFYAGIDDKTLTVIYTFNVEEAVVFASADEADEFIDKLEEVFSIPEILTIGVRRGFLKEEKEESK